MTAVTAMAGSGAGGILAGLGTGMQAASQLQQADAKSRAAQYNAAFDRQQSVVAEDAAAANASDFIRSGSRKLSSDVANQGASGVTPAGSPLMVDSDTIREIALGASRKMYAGASSANTLQNRAQGQDMAAADYKKAGYLAAGTSLLAGTAKFGQSAGMF